MSPDANGPCKVLITRFYSYAFGGIESYLDALLPGLVECGIEPTVVTAGGVADSQRSFLDSLGIPVIEGRVLPDLGVRRSLVDRVGDKHRARRFFRRVLAEGSFDAIHVNTSAPWVQHALLKEAVRAGVPVRIAHGHAWMPWERFPFGFTHALYTRSIARSATHVLACSDLAGRYLYGAALWQDRGVTVKNGIDVDDFVPSPEARRSVREGNVTGLVVGSVTRFTPEKNVPFLLEVFAAVRRLRPDARLWLVGDGPQRQELKRRAAELGIADGVTFWGQRDDVPALLQGMDVMLLPSVREGLPISLVEAQAAGLPCVVSSSVSSEVDVPGCPIWHLSLDEPAEHWAERVVGCADARIANGVELARAAGFDARDCAQEMAQRYRGAI